MAHSNFATAESPCSFGIFQPTLCLRTSLQTLAVRISRGGCFVQPDGTLRADLDGECDVDTVDFSIMQSEFTGPN